MGMIRLVVFTKLTYQFRFCSPLEWKGGFEFKYWTKNEFNNLYKWSNQSKITEPPIKTWMVTDSVIPCLRVHIKSYRKINQKIFNVNLHKDICTFNFGFEDSDYKKIFINLPTFNLFSYIMTHMIEGDRVNLYKLLKSSIIIIFNYRF